MYSFGLEDDIDTEIFSDSSFLTPEVTRAIDGVNYIADHLKTEDDENNVRNKLNIEANSISSAVKQFFAFAAVEIGLWLQYFLKFLQRSLQNV